MRSQPTDQAENDLLVAGYFPLFPPLKLAQNVVIHADQVGLQLGHNLHHLDCLHLSAHHIPVFHLPLDQFVVDRKVVGYHCFRQLIYGLHQ